MEAINNRLGQLENIERTLYIQRQAVIRHRLHEDGERETRRQKEDQAYLISLLDRDHEEDDLRRQRREFWRSSLAEVVVNRGQSETLRASKVKDGLTTSSKAKGRRTASKSNAQSEVDPKGPPIAHDGQGNALWMRPSDGKLVYLNCPIGGCDRTIFINVLAFRNHMSAVEGMHKLKRFPKSNNHALETYGIVAPGQEGPVDDANMPPVSVAPPANMRCADVLIPKPPGSDRDRIDQHRAAAPETPSPTPSLGIKVIDIRTEASHHGMDMVAQPSVERAIKEDGDRSPIFVGWQPLDSPKPESAVAVVVGSSEETVDESMRFATITLETRKRAASEFPINPPPSSKRFRSEDESRTI